MAGVLLLYATTHGHTSKIAKRIARTLSAEGLDVETRRAESAGDAAELARRPSAFVSVSLTAAEDGPDAREATQRCIDDFLDETGWSPARTMAVGGALQYREYDVFTRVLMRLMMRRGGHTTDVSQDHEYTDWDAVDRFSRDFAALVRSPG